MDSKLFPTNEPVNDEIIALDLSVTKKKKFRFNKDDSRILELNTSDLNLLSRVSETYPKLQALQDKASKLMDGIEVDETNEELTMASATTMAERLRNIDNEMRGYLDYMFNANVSEITAPDGSMYDPFQGSFRYEYIINLLITQYETNLRTEFGKMEKQLKKHTEKYTRR